MTGQIGTSVLNGFATNGFLLFLNENQFLIDLKESFIRLIKIINVNEIEIEYNWFSFCTLVKTGKDYVRTVINNFLDFVENIDKYSSEKL